MGTRTIRTGRRALLAGALLFLALGGAPTGARAEPEAPRLPVAAEDGALAPAHGWTQEDGCPARTGASAARALRGPLERAWKSTAKEGSFEGEPLAWKDRVFLVERAGKRRVLRVLLGTTGIAKGSFAVDSEATLAPCVGDGRVVLRTSPTAVEGLVVGDALLSRRWKVAAKEGIGAPTLLRDEVYLVRDGVLERWSYGAASPTWPRKPDGSDGVRIERDPSVPASPRYPRPSVRGGSVFVASGRELVEVDRATGAERGRAPLGELADAEAAVVVARSDVFVRRTGGIATRLLRLSPGAFETRDPLRLPAGLAAIGGGWAALVEDQGQGQGQAQRRLFGGRGGSEEGTPFLLAGEGQHDEFLTPVPPTAVAGTVYVGLRAFSTSGLAVLRASGATVASRAVPCRDRLFLLESSTVVSAWREVRAGEEKDLLATPAAKAAVASAGAVTWKNARAVLEDGRVLEGPFSYDAKAGTFKSTKPGELPSSPVRSVEAVLSTEAPRRLLLAVRSRGAASGVAAIVRAETAKPILALLPDAVASGDADLARRVLSIAVERGAPDAETGAAEPSVVALEAAGTTRDEAKAADVEARLAALDARVADVLVEVAGTVPKEAPIELAGALVRAALDRAPEHAGAAAWVRARLPKDLPVPEPFQIDEWLEFVEVAARQKVRLWGIDKERKSWCSEGKPPAEDSGIFNRYWSARTVWPGDVDVVTFECGPLVVFSPLERPGAIARCLALGRLVADTLDTTFAPIGPPRKDAEQMILFLFSNKQHYLTQSRPTGEADRGDGLEHTAGHYSPSDNVTRMYFPDDDEDAAEVPGVYAHELTHHWIERRRPTGNGPKDEDRDSGVPGYWVVEGFADFVQGTSFDVLAGKATLENPRSAYADCLSGIATESLIPWPKLLTLTQEDFAGLSVTDRIPVPRRWRLGPVGATAPKVLFYDQGAAVCAYLYLAEGGKHRKALLDYVYAYYGGRTTLDMLEKSTGLPSEELGKRVVAWCRDLVKKG